MSHVLLALLVTAIVLGMSSCASIIHGGSQQVRIISDPAGASVKIYNSANAVVWSNKAPAVATLDRGSGFFSGANYRIEFTKDGYTKQTVYLSSHLDGGWYILGNLLVGGLLGWLIIDPATGAMWPLSPDNATATLDKAQTSSVPQSDSVVRVVLKQDMSPALFKSLPLVRIQ